MRPSSGWEYFRWETVNSLANNDFTKVVALIPLAGYLILFNDEIAGMVTFNALAGVDEADQSPFLLDGLTKLRLVFFGSLSVLFSFVIYSVFRPAALETSQNGLQFSKLVVQRYSFHELARIEGDVYSEYWTERTDAFWIVLGQRPSKKPVVSGYRPDVRAHIFKEHGDYIGFLAREWWEGMMQMHTYRPARIYSFAFGILGYAMLATPTLDIAQAVLRDLFTR